jgi:hypothetical protein
MPPYLKCIFFVVFTCSVVYAHGQPRTANATNTISSPKIQTGFLENKGQVRDQNGVPRTDIDFKFAAPGLNVFVGGNGQLHYQFNKPLTAMERASPGKKIRPTTAVSSCRMDVSLLNANPDPEVEKEGKQVGFAHYYTNIAANGAVATSYEKITYKNVYPGIDWEIYVKEQKLKYNFIVHKNGNVADIRLKFEGADTIHLSSDGGLMVRTPLGSIREDRPYSYELETKKEIASGFKLNGNVLTFNTNPCKGTLVVDPEVSWTTYYGGSGLEEVNELKTDSRGNVFITGLTRSVADIATTGSFQHLLSGGYDAFLAGFTSTGLMKWATYFGDTGNDYAFSLAIDFAGNLIVTGATTSDHNIATPGAHQAHYGDDATFGLGDAFVAKFSQTGKRLWATYLGGSEGECGNAVVIDADDNIYIGGYTMSENGMATPGSYKSSLPALPTGPPPADAFIAKFNAAGQLDWSTYYGGPDNDFIAAMHMTAAGTIMVLGETSSLNLSTAYAWQPAYGGGSADAFITRFSTNGTPDWCTYFGGADYEHPTSIVVDQLDNVYIAGSVYGDGQIVTPNACQTLFGGGSADGFLAKFNSQGLLDWSTYIGGGGFDQVNGIAADSFQNIVVAGLTGSPAGILQAPGSGKHVFEVNANGAQPEGFLARYNTLGQRLWGTYYEGVGKSVGCYGNGNIYFTGYTTARQLATPNAYQMDNKGSGDVFLSLIKEDTTVFVRQPFVDTQFCAGAIFRLPYGISNSFLRDNTFTALLSDSSGSFLNAVVVGAMHSAGGGEIICRIPPGTPAGSKYRLRIAANHPVDTSTDNYHDIQIRPGTLVAPIVTVVSIPSIPVPGQSTDFTATVVNGGAATTTWQWLKNGAPIPGATTNPYTTIMDAGDLISVIAYCHLPCAYPDSAISNRISTGISRNSSIPANLYLHPNPNNGSFLLEGKVKAGALSLQITNVIGQPVFDEAISVTNNNLSHRVHTGNLAPGIYFLKASTAAEGVITSLKFTVQQ